MDKITHYGWQDTTNFVSPQLLHVNSCGKQVCQRETSRGGYTLLRENGRVDYHLLYIIEGRCILTHSGRKRTLGAGEGVFYKPHERQEYHFPAEVDTATFWLHFSGSAAADVLKRTGLWDNAFFCLRHPQATEQLFSELIREQRLKPPQFEWMSAGLLLSILAAIARDITTAGEPSPYERILPALSAMQEHPEQNTDLAAYAAMCHLSKSRFVHLFTAFTGSAPHHYRLSLRIRRAKELLAYSQMTVTEIAASVGFSDPLYFSRLFRQYAGCSPRAYRQQKTDKN